MLVWSSACWFSGGVGMSFGLLDWLSGLLVGIHPSGATRLLYVLAMGCLCPGCGLCSSIGMVPWLIC